MELSLKRLQKMSNSCKDMVLDLLYRKGPNGYSKKVVLEIQLKIFQNSPEIDLRFSRLESWLEAEDAMLALGTL